VEVGKEKGKQGDYTSTDLFGNFKRDVFGLTGKKVVAQKRWTGLCIASPGTNN